LLDVGVVDGDWERSEVDGFFSDVDLLIVARLKAFEEDVGVVVDLGMEISLAAVALEDCLVDCTVMVELRVLLIVETGSGEVVKVSGLAEEAARMTLLEPAIGIIDTLVE
jgi:predicted nucleotidyltransferase